MSFPSSKKALASLSITVATPNSPAKNTACIVSIPTTAPAPNDFDQQRDAKELSDQRARDATELSAFDERQDLTLTDLDLPQALHRSSTVSAELSHVNDLPQAQHRSSTVSALVKDETANLLIAHVAET